MARIVTLALAVLIGLAFPTTTLAAFAQVNFNDLTPGLLEGQGGGTGMSGLWTNDDTNTVDVVGGDLTAPLSTNFALTQGGTAQSVFGDSGSGEDVIRTLSTPLNGTIWWSFLLNQPNSAARGGIDLGGSSLLRIVAVGSNLRIIGDGDQSVSGLSLNTTSLILGKIVVNASGDESVSIWIDPDLENLGSPDLLTAREFLSGGGLTSIRVESYHSGGTIGGTVDLISLSDGAGAYFAVTGVPAPAALPAGLIALASLAARRHRRAR